MADNKCSSCEGTGKYTWWDFDKGEAKETTDCPVCDGSGFDTHDKDYPTCPHCGYQQQDDHYGILSGEWECGECGQTCEIEVEHRTEFTTRRCQSRAE